jgi:hypothetical protein
MQAISSLRPEEVHLRQGAEVPEHLDQRENNETNDERLRETSGKEQSIVRCQ